MATDEGRKENKRIRDKLRKSYSAVVASIDPNESIANKLFEDDIITMNQLTDIRNHVTSVQRAEKMFSILYETANPIAFISFREAISSRNEYSWIISLIDEKSTLNTYPGALKNYLKSEEFARSECLNFKATNAVHFSDFSHAGYVTGMKLNLWKFCEEITVIGGIERTYSDGVSVLHGSNNYGFETYEFKLDPQEKIVSAEVRCGFLLDALTFTTNTGKKYGQYGGNGGSAYSVNPPNGAFLAYLEGTVEETEGCKAVRHLRLVWGYY